MVVVFGRMLPVRASVVVPEAGTVKTAEALVSAERGEAMP